MSGPRARRTTSRSAALLLGLAGLGCLGLALGLAVRLQPLPRFWTAMRPAMEESRLLSIRDRQGNLVARLRTGEGEASLAVRLGEIDSLLVQATLAAEDRRFRSHPGVDPLAVARAAWLNLRRGRAISGGSTLTQQLVKLCLLQSRAPRVGAASRSADPVSSRPSRLPGKLVQAYWALVLDAHLSKDEILEAYLNLAPYGPRERGAGAASLTYFGHPPRHLTLEEAALLAALPQSPVRLDPRRDPERARRARDRILRRMPISAEDRAAAMARPLGLVSAPPSPIAASAPHWIMHARQAWPNAAEIRLPLDPSLQRSAENALRSALRILGPAGADAGAAIAIENGSGEVRAWVGSPDWGNADHGQFDAAAAKRQPGSALKPFTYALAFEEGLRPATLLPDFPEQHPGAGGSFRPRNYSGAYHGPVLARAALANSWNAPAVEVLNRIGPERLLAFLHEAGIQSLSLGIDAYGLGLTLGVGEVSLLELTDAYASLARGGVRLPRVEFLEVRDAAGRRIHGPGLLVQPDSAAAPGEGTPPGSDRRILDRIAAFYTTSILSDERARARAFGMDGPFSFPFPVAIKTGTSSDWRDNWAFGYTRDWTVGIWVGCAAGASMDRVSGTHGAVLALRQILLDLYPEGSPAAESACFEVPGGVVERAICSLTGMEAGPDCPETLDEWFDETDPVGEPCNWHRRIAIDASTGLLARTCTPPELVRRTLYTTPEPVPHAWVEADFELWARDQNWPVPPDESTGCRCGNCPDVAPAFQGSTRDLALGPRSTASRSSTTGPTAASRGARCRILRPQDGTVYAIDPSLPAEQQEVALEGSAGADSIRWMIDGRVLAVSRPGERVFWRLIPGTHRVRAERVNSGEAAASHDEVMVQVEAGL